MALLNWIAPGEDAGLTGEAVVLRAPRGADHAAWAAERARSRDYLTPWEPAWPADDLSRAAFRRRVAAYDRERELGQAFAFFVFERTTGDLAGAITLSNVRRGVADTGTVGYWIGQGFAGRGLATGAVRALAVHAFGPLKLHRLEASCLPTNAASRRVLEKAGFTQEGQARAYLKINGDWADHLLFGLIEDEVDRGD